MNDSKKSASFLQENIREHILLNGLKIICLKKQDAPVISVQMWYKCGSAYETDGIRGISHFLEHMMFRGSKNFGPEEHSRQINDVGGHYNAFTAEDVTAYLNSVPRDCLQMVLKLEADRMVNLAINEQILNTERNIIVEEFQTYMNNPLSKAFLEFRKEFFKDSPYSYSALGRLEDISTITVDDCLAYYRGWYAPSNAVCAIVGDFKDYDMVFSMVNDAFGNFSSSAMSALPFDRNSIIKTHSAAWTKRDVDFDIPVTIIGYPAPAAADKDAVPLEMMQIIISQGESSRLHRTIVRKQSLAVMAGGMNQCLKLGGMSLFFAVFTPDMNQRHVQEAMVTQVESMTKDGITRFEMEKVKNAVLTNRTFELYSADHICHKLGYSETIEGDFRLWARRLSVIESLDIDEMESAAQRFWNESVRHVLYLKPKKINPVLYATGLFRRIFPGKKR